MISYLQFPSLNHRFVNILSILLLLCICAAFWSTNLSQFIMLRQCMSLLIVKLNWLVDTNHLNLGDYH